MVQDDGSQAGIEDIESGIGVAAPEVDVIAVETCRSLESWKSLFEGFPQSQSKAPVLN